MPAEWERHEATWIAWPHHEPDWPGKLAPIPWVYAEIVRALSDFDRVNSNHAALRKRLGDSVERDTVVRIVERRYKNGAIGDVEVGVTRG